MAQNTSHAVMAQRHKVKDTIDDFPTPPWATEALMRYVLCGEKTRDLTCLEPACGRGYMSEVLKRHFKSVTTSDKYEYGYAHLRDFIEDPYSVMSFDWVITNPPFRLAEEFVLQSLNAARIGVAILARTVFMEGQGRYNNIFTQYPPAIVSPFVERVPIVRSRVDPKASSATSYSWFIWRKEASINPKIIWIPPCKKAIQSSFTVSCLS